MLSVLQDLEIKDHTEPASVLLIDNLAFKSNEPKAVASLYHHRLHSSNNIER